MDTLVEINRYLQAWLLRYRLQRTLRWMSRGVLAGLGLVVILSLWLVPQAVLLLGQFIQIALSLITASLLLAGLAGFLWPINRINAIRTFDRRFNLQERISTAMEFSDARVPDNHLLTAQRQDTLEHVRRIDLRAILPLRIPWLELGAAVVLLLASTGLAVRNQPQFLAAMQKHNLTKLIQAQAAGLQEIRSQIQEIEHLTPEQRHALEAPLEQAAHKLEAAQSLEEALSALHQAEQELRALSAAELQSRAAGLEQAGQALRSLESSALQPFGEQLAEGDFGQAPQQLGSLDPATMPSEQQSALADELRVAASTLTGSNPELAQELQSAAEALQSGDLDGASQALSQAAQGLNNQAKDLAYASAANQVASQLSASQQDLAQAGSPGNIQANAGNQASNDQTGDSQTAGQGAGAAAGGAANSNAGSSGAGQGESQGEGGNAGQAGSQPIDTGNQTGDGGERPYESIYAPQRLGEISGQDVQLPGSSQDGQAIGEAGQTPGASGGTLIPYSQVFPAYEAVLRQAMESGQVPQHLRALVRDYFSSLAP